MDHRWYELREKAPNKTREPNYRRRSMILGAALGAILLILAAIYVPALWQVPVAVAEPAAAPVVATHADAPTTLAESSLLGDSEALADLYETVAPSIVNIRVTSHGSSVLFPGLDSQGDSSQLIESQGSGFIYDDAGHIVTNNHVIEDADSVLVVFYNGLWAEADIVAADPQADLAVLQVTPPAGFEWRVLPVEDGDNLRVGHTVVAIGNPFGLAGTMTTGIVSALGRGIPVGDGNVTRYTLPDVIQTDAAINPGNSGGPLIDLAGRVVGVTFAIRSTERSNSGVGFAIPAAVVRRVVPALIEDGQFDYAYLGLSGSSISADLASALSLPEGLLGVYVAEVIPGGPSADAGLHGGTDPVDGPNGVRFLRGGDIITAIDGMSVQRFEDLVSYLVTRATPGQQVHLTVVRDGADVNVDVTLGARPESLASSVTTVENQGSTAIEMREAITIATGALDDSGLMTSDIEERVATQEDRNGRPVWVVQFTSGAKVATVVVDAESGEVLELGVK
jgi:S1-C subfamily serine protease